MRYEEPYIVIIEWQENDINTLSYSNEPGTGMGEGEGGDAGGFGM